MVPSVSRFVRQQSLPTSEREHICIKIHASFKYKMTRPNILVTGTPGTGKTTTCELVAAATGMTHVDVGKLIKCVCRNLALALDLN